jgi:hypothetical protein
VPNPATPAPRIVDEPAPLPRRRFQFSADGSDRSMIHACMTPPARKLLSRPSWLLILKSEKRRQFPNLARIPRGLRWPSPDQPRLGAHQRSSRPPARLSARSKLRNQASAPDAPIAPSEIRAPSGPIAPHSLGGPGVEAASSGPISVAETALTSENSHRVNLLINPVDSGLSAARDVILKPVGQGGERGERRGGESDGAIHGPGLA